jgi:hypothetical protein
MTCHSPRPTSIVCLDCLAVVPVKPDGPIPSRCTSCRRRHARQETRERTRKSLPRRTYARKEGPERLGPERPLLGLTEKEYHAWRDGRIVELYRQEPELSVEALAERFGVSTNWVGELLNRAGIRVKGTGRGSGRANLLPAGLPVA